MKREPRSAEGMPGPPPSNAPLSGRSGPGGWQAYGGTLLIVGACSLLAAIMDRHFAPPNLTMIFLLGVVVVAIAFGRGPAVAAAVLSVAVFNFAFVPPRFTFRVSDTQYLVTFGVMLVVAVVIGTLTAWLREQRERARQREQLTAALYRLSRDLGSGRASREVAGAAAERIAEVLEARVAVSLGGSAAELEVVAGDPALVADPQERASARRVHETGQPAAFGSGHIAAPSGLHLRLEAGASIVGVLSVLPRDPYLFDDRERFHLLRTLASQTGLAIERCRLAEDMERVRLQAEAERARNALLSSVSHDLRTPLAAITGAASSLRDGALTEAAREELAETIAEEAQRLNRLIGSLLDMTRLEAGASELHHDWHSLEEIVGSALARLESRIAGRPVQVELPDDLPLVHLDGVLIEQAVANLIENACKYTPADAPIEIRAGVAGDGIHLEVADCGPGLGPGEDRRVFEKFFRGANAVGQPGAGLGLAICQAILQAHGGSIEVANRPGGGARFTLRLPLTGTPASPEHETPSAAPARSAS